MTVGMEETSSDDEVLQNRVKENYGVHIVLYTPLQDKLKWML